MSSDLIRAFLGWLGESALQVALLGMLVLIVELMAWRSLSARARFALWSLVLLRVILPPLPDPIHGVPRIIDLSLQRSEVQDMIPVPLDAEPAVESTLRTLVAKPPAGRPEHRNARLPQRSAEPAETAAPSSPFDLSNRLVALWALGFVFSLGLVAIRELRFRQRLRGSIRITGGCEFEEIEVQARAMGVLRPIEVYSTDLAAGPASAGVFTARLLLPTEFFGSGSPESRRCVLLHELAHLRRFDGAGNFVVAIAQAIQWFNPLLHLAARRFRASREQVRDREALSVVDPPSPDRYAATLLDALERIGDSARRTVPAIGLLEGQEWKRRILMIRSFGSNARGSLVASVVVVGAVASAVVVGATAKPLFPASNPSDAPPAIRVEGYARPRPWLVDLERKLATPLGEVDSSGSASEIAKWIAEQAGFPVCYAEGAQPLFEARQVGLTLRGVTAREALAVLALEVGDFECVPTASGSMFVPRGSESILTESRFYALDPLLDGVFDGVVGDQRMDLKQSIAELVRQFGSDEGEWDRPGYGISVFRDLLVVRADARTHERTLAFLEQLSAGKERVEALDPRPWERSLQERLAARVSFDRGPISLRRLADRLREVAHVTLIVPAEIEEIEVDLPGGECAVRDLCAQITPSVGLVPLPWNGAIRFANAPATEIGIYEVSDLVGTNDDEERIVHREELFEMVRRQVQPGSWDCYPGFVIVGHRGQMIVRQTREAHDEIHEMLGALSRAMSGG